MSLSGAAPSSADCIRVELHNSAVSFVCFCDVAMVASRHIATLVNYFTVKKKVCDLKIDNISYLLEGAVTKCFSESTVKRSLEFVSDLAPRGRALFESEHSTLLH